MPASMFSGQIGLWQAENRDRSKSEFIRK